MRLPLKTSLPIILTLSTVHFPGIVEALWYDEAAVLANAEIFGYLEANKGLNWLQTTPVGYHFLIKLMLSFPAGLFLCRVLSFFSLVIAIYLVDKFYLQNMNNQFLRYMSISILTINSFTLRYATDAKPYSFELLFSISILILASQQRFIRLTFVSLIAPLFSSTVIILGFSAILFYSARYKNLKLIVPGLVITLITALSAWSTPIRTRQVMSTQWFSYESVSVFANLKSFFGGILWLPTSGTGWLNDNSFSNVNSRYLVSGFLFITAVTLILTRLKASPEIYILFCSTLILLSLAVFKLLPPAGRLIQGLSVVFTILLFFALNTFKAKKSTNAIIALFIAISILNNTYDKASQFSTISNTGLLSSKGKSFSTLEIAPELQYRLAKVGKFLQPNIVKIGKSGRLEGCKREVMKKGDRLFLMKSYKHPPITLENLKFHQISDHFGYFEAIHEVEIVKIESDPRLLECTYTYRNPQRSLVS